VETVITPRLFSSELRLNSLLAAPRILKDPVSCQHSGFRWTECPTLSDSQGEWINTVRLTIEEILWRAAYMSRMVTAATGTDTS